MQLLYSICVELLWWLALPFLLIKERFRKVFFARLQQKKTFKDAIRNENLAEPVVWFHCASLGEFEQARPVIESYRKQYPTHFLALTFFSDSGFDQKKNYASVNWIGYLPFDRYFQTRQFIRNLNPSVAFFVKYEVWPNVFFELKKRSVPLHLFSARFRTEQRFFGTFSFFWKTVLQSVKQFYVQDEISEQALRALGFENVVVTGDTRFDRVLEISKADLSSIQTRIDHWKRSSKILVLGSSYITEEQLSNSWLKANPAWKVIVVPHEVTPDRITEIQNAFCEFEIQLWSSFADENKSRILVIDTVGLLSRLYAFADMVVIGGGFNKGIHNTLEAAVYDTPLCFGPKHMNFQEAVELLKCAAAFTFSNEDEFNTCMHCMEQKISSSGGAHYVMKNAGATAKILNIALSKN